MVLFSGMWGFLRLSVILYSVITEWLFLWDLRMSSAAAAKSLQSCPTLYDPIDSSPPGSPIPGILQARTLEWVAISFSNAWKRKVKGKSLGLSNPMDCNLPGSSVCGIFQARVLEWGAIALILTNPSETGTVSFISQMRENGIREVNLS